MKTFLLAAAFVALAASSAMAGSQHRNKATADAAFALIAPDAYAVVLRSRVIGHDPDAAIRHDILRQGNLPGNN